MVKTYEVPEQHAGRRIDIVLPEVFGETRSYWQKSLKRGHVLVSGQKVKPGRILVAGDVIEIDIPDVTFDAPELPVLYEDKHLLVVNKPAGLLVHPTPTSREAAVSHFAAHRSSDTDLERPGIVHRLDRDTSGLLLIAKDSPTKAYLQKLFATRQVHKTYIALVAGHLKDSEAMINLPIGRSLRNPARRAVSPIGRQAVTEYKVIREWPGYSLLEIYPQTGRTHQIRVHMSHLGHAIVGDMFYGEPRNQFGLKRQFLHATKLEFVGPDGKNHIFECPLPQELQTVISNLDKQYN